MSAEDPWKVGGRVPALPRIVLGTRGSELALAQARMAQYALRKRWVIEADIQIIRTSGDERVSRSENAGSRGESVQVTSSGSLDFHADDLAAGKKGMFTAELERALIEKRIDVAVHSAKDLPSEMDGALTIAATLPRAAVTREARGEVEGVEGRAS